MLDPTEVDLFYFDQRSASSRPFLLTQGCDRRFDPGGGCLQDAWPRVWLLLVLLPKQ